MELSLEIFDKVRSELEEAEARGLNIGRALDILDALEVIAMERGDLVTEIEVIVIKVYETIVNPSLRYHKIYELLRMVRAFCREHRQLCIRTLLEDKTTYHALDMLGFQALDLEI